MVEDLEMFILFIADVKDDIYLFRFNFWHFYLCVINIT